MIVVLYNRTDSLLVQMKGYLKRESGCLHFVLARGARSLEVINNKDDSRDLVSCP